MFTSRRYHRSSRLPLYLGIAGIGLGIVAGFMAGANPMLLGVALVAVAALVCFFTKFEQTVLGLLLLRSSLDPFSSQQIPAAFAVGVDALALLYVIVCLFRRQAIQTDKFWWFLAGWVMLQGLWVILLPLGGLGLNGAYLPDALREWIRLFSLLMVYLLVMQLKDRVPPEKIVSVVFLALILPLSVALMQMTLPASLIPPMFAPAGGAGQVFEQGSRINGTLGHPNTFATFVLLFIGLTCWQLGKSKRRLPWLLLLGVLAFFYVSTKALFSLMMLAVFVLVLIAPRLSIVNLIGGVLLLAIVIFLFGSTPFGQERLGSIAQTPLLNPDIDISRAILLSQGDNNSFNWRIAQWTYLLKQWQQFPLFGYGLGISAKVSSNGLYPHNDYVRALVEGGIVGFATFLSFLAAPVVRFAILLRNPAIPKVQRNLCLSLLAVFLALPVGMITENIWTHTTFFFYWWTLFAVAGWNWQKPQSSQLFNF